MPSTARPMPPTVEVAPDWTDQLGELSLLLAHLGRAARVGATERQLLEGGLTAAQQAELEQLERSVRDAMSDAPVEALLDAVRAGPHAEHLSRPWWRFY